MSPDKQRLAIAESCGWQAPFQIGWLRDFGPEAEDVCAFCGTDPSGDRSPVPDFCADLNAMHEAEKVLEGHPKRDDFGHYLARIVLAFGLNEDGVAIINAWSLRRILHAPAAQRAEAFLRTIGKWEAMP